MPFAFRVKSFPAVIAIVILATLLVELLAIVYDMELLGDALGALIRGLVHVLTLGVVP